MMDPDADDFYVDPYDCDDPANEPRPISVVYTTGFKALQELNRKATSLLREPLENSKFQNAITKGLIKEVVKRTKEDAPDQVKFAIVGDMSAGKSSLLNSILSIGTIARKGDGGDSCTWVVQRYQKMFQDQSSPYAAKVRFFNKEEIRNTLGDLLVKYYRAVNKDIKEEDEDGDGEKGDSTKVESFGDTKDTITTYIALFCEHPEFATEDAARSYLAQARSENDPRILDTLVEWASAVVEEYLNGKTALLIENSTPDGLLWDLQPFTYQLGGTEGEGLIEPWPLVSAIDFGLDHPLLNEGIVFVDSPGLSDSNSSRAKNAILSHRECTHKIIVTEIGRAEAADPVRKNLQAGSRTRGTSNMLLVLTRGDSIDPKTDVSGTPTEKRRIDKLETEINDLQAQKTEFGKQRRRARPEDRDDLVEEIHSLTSDIQRLTAEREGCRLDMRNRKVVSNMQKLYKSLTSDPKQLATFAVGNQAYQQHVAGFSQDERPHMSVKQTNIPALRHKLYMMPIQGRLNDTMHLTETQLPNLVNTMELYCAQLHLARKSEIEAIVLAPKKLLPAMVHESFELLKTAVLEDILNPMKEGESEWIKRAKKCSRDWTEKFKGQLHIFKGEGCKKATRGKNNGKPINWNYELLEIGGDSLEPIFDHFFRKVAASSWKKDLTSNLVNLIDNTRRDIRRDSSFHPLALEPFFNTFNGQSRNFEPLVRACMRSLRKEINKILERATTQSHDDFITIAMKQIYRDAAQIKGGVGAPMRRAKFVETALSKRDDGVWVQVHDAMEVAFDNLFEFAKKTMVKRFGEVFDALHNNFCLLCDDSEAKDEDEKVLEKALRDELKEKTAEVKAMLADGGAIAQRVAECKAYQATQAEAAKDFSSMFVSQ